MTRNDALKELENLSYDPSTIDEDFRFVANKIGISEDQLRSYHEMELKSYKDYRNSEGMFDVGAKILQKFGAETAVKR